MVNWWESIEEPTTLKTTLQFLAAIRTNQVLRNEICTVFTEHINGHCNPRDASQRHPFHKLLDEASILRGRLMGQPSNGKLGDYGKYQTIYNSGGELKRCNGTISGCSRIVRDNGINSGACLATIHACANVIVDLLLCVLPKLYNTMMSVWAKLWDDVTYSHQKCNDRDGVLYKLFTSVVDIHEKEKCPYKTLKKLEIGLSQDDMRSNSRGVDVEDAIKSLVWPTGGLWALISLIKKNRFVSAPLPLYASIGTLNPSRTPCKCIEPKVEVIKTTIHSGYGSNRQTSSVRSAGGNATTIRGRTRRSTVSPSVTTTPKPIANPDVSTVTHTHGSFTASSITAGKPAATDITTSSANNYSMSNNTYNYESYTGVAGGSNNTLYLHDPNYASYSSHPTSTLQETRIQEISSGVLDSNSTACGAAAGLLAVGCVGVGAAYVFDIGGFGTMVNGMF